MMKPTIPVPTDRQDIIEFARSCRREGATYAGEWNGKHVYALLPKIGIPLSECGFPRFVLDDGERLAQAEYMETWDIIGHLNEVNEARQRDNA